MSETFDRWHHGRDGAEFHPCDTGTWARTLYKLSGERKSKEYMDFQYRLLEATTLPRAVMDGLKKASEENKN